YRGVDPSRPIDVHAERVGAAGTATSGGAVTTSPSDLLVGFCVADASCHAIAGYDVRSDLNGNLLADRPIAVANTNAAATANADAGWAMLMAALRLSGA